MFNKIVIRHENFMFGFEREIGPPLFTCMNCHHRYPETMPEWHAPHSMVKGHAYVCSEACGLEWLDCNWDAIQEYEEVLNG
jgi:hypothetical protein